MPRADQHYSQESFFENSFSVETYSYSHGTVSAPSSLKLVDGKLPIESEQFVSGPNALALSWQSEVNGGWDAQIDVSKWRNREIDWAGETLYLWVWSKDAIAAAELPKIALADLDEGHTAPIALGSFTSAVAGGKWTRVKIPLGHFKSTTVRTI